MAKNRRETPQKVLFVKNNAPELTVPSATRLRLIQLERNIFSLNIELNAPADLTDTPRINSNPN